MKNELSERTKILLQLVINELKENPDGYYQDATNTVKLHTCNAPMCIMGWFDSFANALGWETPTEMVGTGNGYILKDSTPRGRLYWERHWPKQYQDQDSPGLNKSAKKAIARIQHFIKTDGRE